MGKYSLKSEKAIKPLKKLRLKLKKRKHKKTIEKLKNAENRIKELDLRVQRLEKDKQINLFKDNGGVI